MRSLLVLILALTLFGCAAKEKDLAFNRFTIEVPYGSDTGYFEAVEKLTEKATARCGQGYRKLHDYDTGQAGNKLLIWEVACKGVERTDQVFTRKKGTNAP